MKLSAALPSRRRLIVGALLVTLFVSAWYAHWYFLEHRFSVVSAGDLYQSAEMDPAALADTVREHGIRTVIDLRKEPELGMAEERQALAELGVRYVHIPSEHSPAPETVDAFLAVVAQTKNRPVLVHCAHGEGRSVLFAAIYRIEIQGWENDRARRACRLLPWRGTFSPDGEKGKYLLTYRRRLGQAPR